MFLLCIRYTDELEYKLYLFMDNFFSFLCMEIFFPIEHDVVKVMIYAILIIHIDVV